MPLYLTPTVYSMRRELSLRDSVLLLTRRWLCSNHELLGGVVREMEKQHFMKSEGDR
jgi:hypothetical protein